MKHKDKLKQIGMETEFWEWVKKEKNRKRVLKYSGKRYPRYGDIVRVKNSENWYVYTHDGSEGVVVDTRDFIPEQDYTDVGVSWTKLVDEFGTSNRPSRRPVYSVCVSHLELIGEQ